MGNANSQMRLVSDIYEAAIDRSYWRTVAKRLAHEFDAHQSIIHLPPANQNLSDSIISYGIEPPIHARYLQLLDEDHWLTGMARLPRVTACRSEDFMSREKLKSTVFYNELCVPANVAHMGGAVVSNTEHGFTAFATQRENCRGAFSAGELQVLEMLSHHFERAFFLGQKLNDLKNERDDLRVALNRIGAATFLFDEQGVLCWLNEFAETIATRADGLCVRGDRVMLHLSTEHQEMQRLLSEATKTTMAKGVSAGGKVTITRLAGKRPYQATICPLGQSGGQWGDRATVAVFVVDPESPPKISRDELKSYYKLTPAEISLCEQLLLGKTVSEAADEMEISVNTTRTQLKNIFRKCCVRSQAQLVVKLCRNGVPFGGD